MDNPHNLEPTSVQIHVVNATPADVQFIRNIVSLVTDPAYRSNMESVRAGNSVIAYAKGGAMEVYHR